MKNKILIPGIILVALGVFFSFRYYGPLQDGGDVSIPKEQQTVLQTTMALIQSSHFSPRPLDDSFSHMVFDKVIQRLDFEKKFFTQEDYDRLKSKYRNNLSDEIKNNSLDFFNDVNKVFTDRLDYVAKIYPGILGKPFTFDKVDSMQMDPDKLAFAPNLDGLKNRWQQYLKYRVLAKYVDLKKAEDKKAKDSVGYKPKSFVVLEKEARESISKIQDRYIQRMKGLTDNDRFSLYMECITNSEDPHSDYFPPEQKKQFDEMMSGAFFGIGAALQQQEDGTIKVSEIITGSPAWKQGKLKAKDVILKVQQKDTQPIDIDGMELTDVVKLIRGPQGTNVTLVVKHSDGTLENITITRGKVELDYLFAKSAIIENDGKRIGYIYLPEFYTNFNGAGDRSAAVDVAKEVQKLKEEQVDGIVLDLRDNGGGSLSDVIDMAGIFVGSGPVVQVMTKSKATRPLNNDDGTPLYDGPLAIMVNGNSASASEIMAAAMQDYHRAVIIGSKTYGKGTVQNVVTLDNYVNKSLRQEIIEALNKAEGGKKEFQGIGSLKLTIQKFYRINGGSTQLKGVTPDILLPNTQESDDQGERSEVSALPWDQIKPASYTVWEHHPPYDLLREASIKRVQESKGFDIIRQTAARIKYQQDHNFAPLSLKGYMADLAKADKINKQIDELDSIGKKLTVVNLKVDLKDINVDSSTVSKNKAWLKGISKDLYLGETVNVLDDWVNYNKSKADNRIKQ